MGADDGESDGNCPTNDTSARPPSGDLTTASVSRCNHPGQETPLVGRDISPKGCLSRFCRHRVKSAAAAPAGNTPLASTVATSPQAVGEVLGLVADLTLLSFLGKPATRPMPWRSAKMRPPAPSALDLPGESGRAR